MRVPKVDRARPGSWTLVVTGVLALWGMSALCAWWAPDHNWFFSGYYAKGFQDLLTRYRDVWRAPRGLLYGADHNQYFTYPPAALFLFAPLRWTSFALTRWWWSVVSLASLSYVLATALARSVQLGAKRAWGWGVWLAVASVVVFPAISILLSLGQVGSILMALVAVDYLGRYRCGRGVATGIAAAIKIYPALFVLVMLWRREWRAAGTAISTWMVVTALAWWAWPSYSRTFFFHKLLNGQEVTRFFHRNHWRSNSSSLYSFFYRPPFSGHLALVGSVACVAAVLLSAWSAHRLWRARREVASFVVLCMGAVFGVPVVWDHYFVWAPLLLVVLYELWDLVALRWATILALGCLVIPWDKMRDGNFTAHGLTATSLAVFVARNALLGSSLLVMALGCRATVQTLEESVPPLS